MPEATIGWLNPETQPEAKESALAVEFDGTVRGPIFRRVVRGSFDAVCIHLPLEAPGVTDHRDDAKNGGEGWTFVDYALGDTNRWTIGAGGLTVSPAEGSGGITRNSNPAKRSSVNDFSDALASSGFPMDRIPSALENETFGLAYLDGAKFHWRRVVTRGVQGRFDRDVEKGKDMTRGYTDRATGVERRIAKTPLDYADPLPVKYLGVPTGSAPPISEADFKTIVADCIKAAGGSVGVNSLMGRIEKAVGTNAGAKAAWQAVQDPLIWLKDETTLWNVGQDGKVSVT